MGVAAQLQPLQLVAQEIEAQLLGGPVRDVARIGRAADRVGLAGLDAADRQAQRPVDRPHPLGVAAGQVVVDRDDVHAFAGQSVQERRHGRDQRLALAGFQLGDAAMMDRDAADDLHVELTLADRSLGGLADQGERLGQQAVERITLPGPELQIVGLRLELVRGADLEPRLERVDSIDQHGVSA